MMYGLSGGVLMYGPWTGPRMLEARCPFGEDKCGDHCPLFEESKDGRVVRLHCGGKRTIVLGEQKEESNGKDTDSAGHAKP